MTVYKSFGKYIKFENVKFYFINCPCFHGSMHMVLGVQLLPLSSFYNLKMLNLSFEKNILPNTKTQIKKKTV